MHHAEEHLRLEHHHRDLRNANDRMLRDVAERGCQKKEERHIEAVVDLGYVVRTVEAHRIVDCAVVVGYYKSFDVVVVGHRAESKVVDHHIEVVLVVADALMHHETDREIGTAVVSEELAAGRIEVVRV